MPSPPSLSKASQPRRSDFSMSKAEIIAELPRLSHRERREILQCILDMEQEAQWLADCDRRADERFLMLDVMEAEDSQTATG